MTPAVAEKVNVAAELLGGLGDRMSPLERDRFGLDMAEAIRAGDRERFRRLLIGWKLTLTMVQHPDYEDQYKEFVRLRESGDLFTGLAPSDPLPPAL